MQSPKKEERAISTVERLFDFSLNADMNSCKEGSKKIFESLIGFCNNDLFYEDVSLFENETIRVLSQLGQKMGRLATKDVNRNLLNTALGKLQRELQNQERVIAYMDNGLLSKGKDGVLLTNDALYFIKGKKTSRMRIVEIDKIILKVNSVFVYFDDDFTSDFHLSCFYDNGDTEGCSRTCAYIALRKREILRSSSKIMTLVTKD